MVALRWTEDEIRRVASGYASRSQFADENNAAALRARKYHPGLLDELFPLLDLRAKRTFSEQEIRAVAAGFTTRADFAYRARHARAACNNFPGLLDSLFPDARGDWSRKWDADTIRAEAAKYPSRVAFEDGCPGAVGAARERHPGLLDELFPPLQRKTPTLEEARALASKYPSRKAFNKGHSSAYNVCRKAGVLDELFADNRGYSRFKWTEEAVREEAKKYKTKREFERDARGAAARARKLGIIDELGLEGYPPSDNDAIYIWRAAGEYFNGHPVYKIGVTSARLGTVRIEQVAKDSGFEFDLICCEPVACKATELERKLHILGESPGYTGFDGCTEFRALSDSALYTAVTLICSAIQQEKPQ